MSSASEAGGRDGKDEPGQAGPERAAEAKRRSIAGSVTGSLAVIIVSLLVVAILGLSSFMGFRLALKRFSEQEIPKMIQAARLAESTNQLIFEVERLAAADSDANRRIAYDRVRTQLDRIAELSGTDELSAGNQTEALKVLDSTLSELDSLVASRLDMFRRTEEFHALLWKFPERAVRLLKAARAEPRGTAGPDAATAWLEQVMAIISLAGDTTTHTGLKQIRQAEDALMTEMDSLALITGRLPREAGARLSPFNAELETTLFGERGLIELLTEHSAISRQSTGRINFARSMVSDFRSASGMLFNSFVNAAAENTKALSRMVNKTLFVFIFSVVATAIAFVLVVIRLRSNLIIRLVNLNAAILEQVAGGEVTVTATGNDEITDMARSFTYYAAEVAKRETALRELATKDALTGINNRRNFLELAEKEIRRAERYNHATTFLMMDIDHFKHINDSWGHPAGDLVLKAFVGACRSALREVDCLGRLGGEEFGVLLPETDRESGIVVANRLREAVGAAVCNIGESSLSCTVSIGLVTAEGGGYDLEELMKSGDEMLYTAKKSGRNCVRWEA